jgi:penicillin amidase
MRPLVLSITLACAVAIDCQAQTTSVELLAAAKKTLAQLDGQINVPGLRQPVEVLRDRWGVPHIYAQNQHDLFFAQGFVAAQDRLFQIDLWRRTAIGETAAVLGKQAIEADCFARLVKYRGDMQLEWQSYGPDAQAIATAFTDGINAYVDHLGDRLPIEFAWAGFKPARWKPEDCLGRMSGVIMTRNFRQEIQRAQLVAAVGIEKVRWLAPTDPQRDFTLPEGLDLTGIDQSVLAGYEAATRAMDFSSIPNGSNNWAIAGGLSASGKPLMASDPHRALGLPSLRYLVHLHAPGWNVIGSGEPGLPGVALGHNERIAWGLTIVGNDQADVVVEETHPDDPTKYRTPSGWQPMQVIRESLEVRGQATPEQVVLRFTRNGPIVHEDREHRRAYVLRWVGSEPGTAAYLGSLVLDRAQTQTEFVEGLRRWKLPSENMVYADVEGNIGWLAAALTPVRPHGDGLLPVPGATDKYQWNGFVAYDQLPQTVNPPEQFIATANHNILPENYRHQIAYEWAPDYRYDRIEERIVSHSGKLTVDDCLSIQHDDVSLPGRQLARFAATIRSDDAEINRHAATLAGWDGSLSRESQAAALYAAWLQELLRGLYQPHVPKSLVEALATGDRVPVLLAALEQPEVKWFGNDAMAGRDRLLEQSLKRAAKRLERSMSADNTLWRWGKLHTITFRHALGSLGPEFAKALNLGPIERPGDGLTPNATRHDNSFRQVNGATYRHVFDLADWDRGVATSAPGQSGQPGSSHYADLLPLWAEGRAFPLLYTRQAIEQATLHKLQLAPAVKESNGR